MAGRLLDGSGRVLMTWRKLSPATAAFSPDSAFLAFGTENSTIRLISTRDRKIVKDFKMPMGKNPMPGVIVGIGALAFSPVADPLTLVAALDDGTLTAWNPKEGKLLATLAHGKQTPVTLLPWGKENLLAVIGQEVRLTDYSLKKWDAEQKLPGRSYNISASTDRSLPAIACSDLTVTLLDGNTLKPLRTVKEKGMPPAEKTVNTPGFSFQFIAALSPKGDRLFTAVPEQNGGTVTVWDAKTGEKTGSFTHPMPRSSLGLSSLHLSVTQEGKVKTFWSNVNISPALLWTVQEK